MKNYFYFLLILFLTVVILSCERGEMNFADGQLIHESSIKSSKTDRFRIDENFSVVLTHEYLNGTLINIDYEKVASKQDDRFQILDLSLKSETTQRLVVLDGGMNENYAEYTVKGGDTEYGCECKTTDKGDTNDCLLRSYYGIKYCDGNLCKGCSLMVQFLTKNNQVLNIESSAVILPFNFNNQKL